MNSCAKPGNNDNSDLSSGSSMNVENNLAVNAPYAYDYGFSVEGDPSLSVLTNGVGNDSVTLKTNLKKDAQTPYELTFTDWYKKQYQIELKNNTVAVSVDLGFMSSLSEVGLNFTQYKKADIGIFTSTDGYNFTNFAGAFSHEENDSKWRAKLNNINAKAVMFVMPLEYGEEIKLNQIVVNGTRQAEKKLLSLGASYEWDGLVRKDYPDSDNKKLTDGQSWSEGKDTETLVGKQGGTVSDPITGKKGAVITIDLGSEKNVSEVMFGAFIKSKVFTLPDRIDIRYSADKENWTDFGQSFLRTSNGKYGNNSYKFMVTRNHTVKARYISIYTYFGGLICLDEVYVYGADSEIKEPDYDFINRKNQLSNTNIASYKPVTLNGAEQTALSDMSFLSGINGQAGKNEIKFSDNSKNVCAVALTVKETSISDLKLYCDNNEVKISEYKTNAAGSSVIYAFLEKSTNCSELKFEFSAQSAPEIIEFSVYSGQPQLPLVRGGFFQLPTNGGMNPSSLNSDYTWYLQLKGMRDQGMEYVVIQYSTHYLAKTTLINGKNITDAGYKYNQTYGTTDLCKSVLDAAQKLGMKVFLGTIHDSDFTKPLENQSQYEAIVNDSYLIIKDIKEMYGSHPAFGGYYLSDETCDQWLNNQGGVEACRFVYEKQSDYIRQIDPEKQIMIAPAIWRSGAPEMGAENLYKMIAPKEEGGRPVVDILAAQDCLGRESSLEVTDKAYNDFESYVEEWAKAVRRAGVDFWHDMEIFEIISSQKRHADTVKSLAIEAKTSGSIIVFDIPHYMSSYSMSSYNDEYDYYKRLIMREYTEYYATLRQYDRVGTDAEVPQVIIDDGKQPGENSGVSKIPPKVYDKPFNKGAIVNKTPDFNSLNAKWKQFSAGNGSGKTPQYALYWDNDAAYIAIKSNDSSANFQDGTWWSGKDDLVQIWISGNGETANTALESKAGIRFYLHRTGDNTWVSGGESAAGTSFSEFTFEQKNGTFLVKMPWSSFGRVAPAAGDGTAIGIKIQYIDGADQSWAASDGTKDQSVKDSALYSF